MSHKMTTSEHSTTTLASSVLVFFFVVYICVLQPTCILLTEAIYFRFLCPTIHTYSISSQRVGAYPNCTLLSSLKSRCIFLLHSVLVVNSSRFAREDHVTRRIHRRKSWR